MYILSENVEKSYDYIDNLANPTYPQVASGSSSESSSGSVWKIVIQKSQIMYDIEAELGIVAKMRRNEVGADSRLGIDVADGYRPIIARWINFWANRAKDKMRSYLVEIEQDNGTDGIRDWTYFIIKLSMPDYWDCRVWDTLVDAVHEFIVRHVLAQYYELTLTAQDPLTVSTQKRAEDADNDIKHCISAMLPQSIKKPFYPLPR